jgi:hypothetical protein
MKILFSVIAHPFVNRASEFAIQSFGLDRRTLGSIKDGAAFFRLVILPNAKSREIINM